MILPFFPPYNKPSSIHHPVSPFHRVLCQIWEDRQGQIHPHGPQLALTPVTGVSARGRRFHARCTICPVFTPLSICISDRRPEWHQHEAPVTKCYCFSWGRKEKGGEGEERGWWRVPRFYTWCLHDFTAERACTHAGSLYYSGLSLMTFALQTLTLAPPNITPHPRYAQHLPLSTGWCNPTVTLT